MKSARATARILVVDDDEWSRDIMARRLARRGFRVIPAADGKEAITLARQHSPDLILMDLSLPVMDGWTSAGHLRSDAATCHIPIIAVTAHALASDRQKAIDAGCDDYYTKPVDFVNLVRRIELLLRGRRTPPVIPVPVRPPTIDAAVIGDPPC